MTPDPRHGHLFDAASASGFGLDRLGVRPVIRRSASPARPRETAYTRWVIAVDLAAVLLVGVAGVLLKSRLVDPVLAGATGVMVTVTTLLMIYLVGAWDPSVLGNGGTRVPQAGARVRGRRRGLALADLATRIADLSAWVFGVLPGDVRARDPRRGGAAPSAAPTPPRGRVQA
jgi:hypothetical protein